MDSHEITKTYRVKGKNHQGEGKTYRMGESFANHTSAGGLITRMYRELKGINNKITTQSINGPMEWTGNSQEKKSNGQWVHEKINIPHL